MRLRKNKSTYKLPQDFGGVVGAEIRVDGIWYRLVHLQYEVPNDKSAHPTHFVVSRVGGEVTFYPPPTKGYTVKFHYIPKDKEF